jgi:hypothetical protein
MEAETSAGEPASDGAVEEVAAPEAELTPEQQAEIEAALAADQAEREEAQGAVAEGEESGRAGLGRGLGRFFQSLNPDLSFILDLAFAWYSTDDHLQTGEHDPAENGFNFQQLELSVRATVDPYFRFDGNLVIGADEVELEEAYATTLGLPGRFQLRLGQMLTRFGRVNGTHPHSWDFVDQPFAIGRVFGSEGNSGLGLELSWLTPLPWYVEVVGSATDAEGATTSRSFYGGHDPGIDGLEDFLYLVAIKQFFPLSDDWSLSWGISAAFGPNGTGADARTEVYATDIYLKWRPISRQGFTYQIVSLTTEWLYRRRDVPGDTLQDVTGYVQVYWRFSRRWATAARYEYGSPPYGSDGDPSGDDDLDPSWTDHRHRVAVSFTFWPTEFSRLRLQGLVDVPQWRDEVVWAGMLAAEFVTGEHGAHVF